MTDFYPEWGIHQGFMAPFAQISGFDMATVLGHYASLATDKKLKGLSGSDKISRCTDAIESLRQHFSLQTLIEDQSKELSEDAISDLNQVLDEIFADDPVSLDVFFELMEWNISGPQNLSVFTQMLSRLIDDPLAAKLNLSSSIEKLAPDLFQKFIQHSEVDE